MDGFVGDLSPFLVRTTVWMLFRSLALSMTSEAVWYGYTKHLDYSCKGVSLWNAVSRREMGKLWL